MQTVDRTLIFVPTYNEAENVLALFEQINSLGLDADILFMDDNSPDGTGDLIDTLARTQPRVRVLHRPAKLGIGSAHLEAIRWAYHNAYSVLVTMDCDFTHSPSAIPEFLAHIDTSEVVIGSRFLRKDSLPDWNLFRRVLTYGGHLATRVLLGMSLDASGAFRLYRLDRIRPEVFELVCSRGYAFFFESLYILWLNSVTIKEVPVTLPARTQGHSKMTVHDAFKSFRTLLSLHQRLRRQPETLKLPCKPLTNAGLAVDHRRSDSNAHQMTQP